MITLFYFVLKTSFCPCISLWSREGRTECCQCWQWTDWSARLIITSFNLGKAATHDLQTQSLVSISLTGAFLLTASSSGHLLLCCLCSRTVMLRARSVNICMKENRHAVSVETALTLSFMSSSLVMFACFLLSNFIQSVHVHCCPLAFTSSSHIQTQRWICRSNVS